MIEISLESRVENDTLIIRVVLPEEKLPQYEYAYYFIKDGERILTKWYSANYEERFVLEEPGAYYVTCFARNIENKNDMASKYTRLYTYPWGEENEKAVFEEKSLSESQFSICSRIEGGMLECEVHPSDNKFKDIEFAFYLMNRFEKKETVSYSPYNRTRFPLTSDGIYSVKCFIRRGQELMVKMSRFHGYKAENTFGLETNVREPFRGGQLQYIPFKAPYTDFCLVITPNTLENAALNVIKKHTELDIDGESWYQSHLYKIGNKEVIGQDTILSGMINEGPHLIFGQKDIRLLEDCIDEGQDVLTMIGKFMIYRKKNVITVTCDYFSANSVFYYWDEETVVVSNRLNLALTVIRAIGLDLKINKEYVAAMMTFSDGMISGTNFLTELAVKNLYILPVNRYIEISEYGLCTPEKPINYKKTAYNDTMYRELLEKAKNDIMCKLENIKNSEDLTHYQIGLSAGFDSRLNLASLLCNPEMLNQTRAVTWDVPSANDLRVSVQLTNHYNISYARNEEYGIYIKEYSVDDFIERYRNFNNGIYHAVFYLPGFTMESNFENQTMSFVGAFGETMRSHYYMGTRNLIKNSDNVMQIARKMTNKLDNYRITYYGDSDFCKALYGEITAIPGGSAYEKFDNLFTFHYLRYHFNDLINRFWLDGHYYSLFMSRYLFEASRMLSMEERCNNKIMLDMCYTLYPEVLSFPFSSYGSSDNDIIREKWGNVIFDQGELPEVELDNDKSDYETAADNNSRPMRNPGFTENELLLQIYNNTLDLYNVLRKRQDIGQYFDEHLYYYIQCVKTDMRRLVYIFSKLCGIYDQIYGIEDC